MTMIHDLIPGATFWGATGVEGGDDKIALWVEITVSQKTCSVSKPV